MSPGGGDIPDGQGDPAGVVVQPGVSEMVAGSLGAGDRLAEQLPGRGRANGLEIQEQAGGQQEVVAERPGALDRLLAERESQIRLAGEEMRAAQLGESFDEQPVIAQPAGGPDRLFSELPCHRCVNEFSDDRGGDQCRREQPGIGAGFGPLEYRRQQPDGLLPPAARQPVTVERDAQAQYRRGAVRVPGRVLGSAPQVGLSGRGSWRGQAAAQGARPARPCAPGSPGAVRW